MNDNYHYPAGADNDDAPWNQPPDHELVKLGLSMTVSLFNVVTVETSNYSQEDDDETQSVCVNVHDNAHDLEQYYKNQHYSIEEMLVELQNYIQVELLEVIDKYRKEHLQAMLEDAKGWTQQDIDIEDYEVID